MNGSTGKRKDRIITVDSAYRPDRYYYHYRSYARMRLQGRWLERAGFTPGSVRPHLLNPHALALLLRASRGLGHGHVLDHVVV